MRLDYKNYNIILFLVFSEKETLNGHYVCMYYLHREYLNDLGRAAHGSKHKHILISHHDDCRFMNNRGAPLPPSAGV